MAESVLPGTNIGGVRVEILTEQNSLDFDEEFVKVEAAIYEYDSVGNAPQRKGESVFQWNSIENACLALLEKAKDIRVAVWYVRACMARRGLAGLVEGIRLLADIVRLPIEQIHPLALPDESPGERHVIHLGWISGSQFLHQLGCARFDNCDVTVSDLAQGDASAILEDRHVQVGAHSVLHEIRHAFLSIEDSMLAAGQSFEVSRVVELLDSAIARLKVPDIEDGSAEEVPDASTHRALARPEALGALKTRKEVGATLERIVEYFRVHEPSHPAPIFLLRIQRMLGAGFEEVMAELYPEAVSLVAQLDRPRSPSQSFE